MSVREADPVLAQGYRQCAAITRRGGTTYHWGAMLLPPERRQHVYAVYALCRLADDIVDDAAATEHPDQTRSRLASFQADFQDAVRYGTTDPVLAAAAHTARSLHIPETSFDRFFRAMAMDLTVTRYQTWGDLLDYMDGSAAVIGEMMLPVLQPRSPEAIGPARALGLAFQLTNFLRDVAEDLDRGRIYLPQEDLQRFGVDPMDLQLRRVTPSWRKFMADQLFRTRELYREADTGVPMLPPRSARCVAAARLLYSQILDRIEAADYNVFSSRIRVPTWRKAGTAARMLVTGPGK